ncbi:MAG: ABC transporter permease, partial [Bradyrhizobium sp.]
MTELTAPNVVAEPSRSDRRRKLLQSLLRGERPYMLYIAFVVLLVVFSLSSPWFLSVDNFLNIGRQTTLVSIIAVGMTFVIIARQIDLSVASTLALSGMAAALAMSQISNSWIVGAAAGLGTGALVGLLNGILTTQLSIPSFLVTLGSLSMARGLAMMVTNTKPVIITNEAYFAIFGEGTFLGIPVPIAWTLAAMIVGILLLHYNVFGRRIYAVGGNPTAALYSGINTKWVTTAAFVLTGALAGLAALVLSARSHAARVWWQAMRLSEVFVQVGHLDRGERGTPSLVAGLGARALDG